MRRLLWAAHDKFGHLEEHTQFFFCLTKDVKSWLTSMEANVARAITFKCMLNGVPVEQSSVTARYTHIKDISSVYGRHYSAHRGSGVYRKAVIVMLWSAAGRTAEVAHVCWELVEWEAHHEALVLTWPEWKNNRYKYVLLVAGRERVTCPFNVLADFFASGVYSSTVMGDGETAWLFPHLAGLKDAGSAIGNFVKDISTEAGVQLYK